MAQSQTPAFNVFDQRCPSQSTLRDLSGRWVPLVMMALDEGMTRFGEIHRRIGGSNERMISQTLRMLEDDGLVERMAAAGRPAYQLTAGGHDIAARYRELVDALYTHLSAQRA
ncbi:MAG: winged helix-turn-helix transcriptional regulator [Ancrocorticia sp.]|uniref:winged helix-turn-helix transcriptional regulator n=1 Tax=Ancrocorticia sp. TaxID=2593684 RepID=UPI003F90A97E